MTCKIEQQRTENPQDQLQPREALWQVTGKSAGKLRLPDDIHFVARAVIFTETAGLRAQGSAVTIGLASGPTVPCSGQHRAESAGMQAEQEENSLKKPKKGGQAGLPFWRESLHMDVITCI